MAFLNMILAGLTALIATFLSVTQTGFHGLAPWLTTLSVHPVERAPCPCPSQQDFLVPDFFNQIPTVNLTTPDIATEFPGPIISESPPPLPDFPFALTAEEGTEEDEPEGPNLGERLYELLRMFKRALLHLTIGTNDFVLQNPYLRSPKIECRLRRVGRLEWIIPPLSRSRSPSRGRSNSLSPIRLRSAVRTRALSSSPRLPSAPTPAPSSTPLPSSPPTASPPTASPPTASRTRPPIIQRLHQAIERRETKRINELEEEMGGLKAELKEVYSQLEEMRRRSLARDASAPASRPPLPHRQPCFPGQPVLDTGSAPALSPPTQPSGFVHRPRLRQSFGYGYPHHPHQQRYPARPGQARGPRRILSPEELGFRKCPRQFFCDLKLNP